MFLFHAKESKRETAGIVGMAQTAGNSPRERRLQSWVKKYIFRAALSIFKRYPFLVTFPGEKSLQNKHLKKYQHLQTGAD